MTAPVAEANGPRATPPRIAAPARPDREATEGFRDALARRSGRMEQRTAKANARVDGEGQATAPMTGHFPPPFQQGPRKNQDRPGGQDDGRGAGQVRTADAAGPPPAPAAPVGTGAADAAAFAALVARFDAGAPTSAATQLTLPGEQWRTGQVVIDQQAARLSVSVDLGADADGKDETLKELEARLRARGLDASVGALTGRG